MQQHEFDVPPFQFVPIHHVDGSWQFLVLDQDGGEIYSGDNCFLTWEAALLVAVSDLLDHVLPEEPRG